jgi:GT2 family glycosyltransferase
MNKSIAVLLTCHNRREKTISCLDALFCCYLPENFSLDVYLVDDGSSDGTTEAVKNKFPLVNIIQGNGNLYWNRGMHLAWSHASLNNYDFYLWLNDDTILKVNALNILFTDSKSKNNQSILCGICQSKNTGKISYGGFEKSKHQMIYPNGQPQLCYFFNGNIVLVPQIVFQKVGNLDPFFHHEFGDFDYGLRAIKKNISSWTSSEIIGYCENNELKKWCNPKYPFLTRLKIFNSPLGISPVEHFVYAKRHWGFLKACQSFISQHLRLMFPSFWIKNNQ